VVWGVDSPWLWGANVGHLWRTTGDINRISLNQNDSRSIFKITSNIESVIVLLANWWRIMDILDAQDGLEQYAGPGGWNGTSLFVSSYIFFSLSSPSLLFISLHIVEFVV
jgi:hypothetical protein